MYNPLHICVDDTDVKHTTWKYSGNEFRVGFLWNFGIKYTLKDWGTYFHTEHLLKHAFLVPGQSRQLRIGKLGDISFDCSKRWKEKKDRGWNNFRYFQCIYQIRMNHFWLHI